MAHDEVWIPIPLEPPHHIDHYRSFFNDEEKIMPDPRYLDYARAKTRRLIALNAIEAYYKCDDDDFDAFIPYLAMNYFDRVISMHEIEQVTPDEKMNDDLFVISCLTLAWKTRTKSVEHPYFLEKLQEDYKDMDFFNMEIFIHRKLRCAGGMRPSTPFTFVEYFISISKLTGDQLTSARKLVHQIIVTSQADARIVTFKPSLVAASAVYVVSKMLLPKQSSSVLRESLIRPKYITKQGLSSCKKILQPICNAKFESWKSSSENTDSAETSSSGLEGTGQLAGASSSSQPKPALQGASSSSLQETSTPGAPGSGELSTPTQSISRTVPEATIQGAGTGTEEEEGEKPMGETQQDLTAGEKAEDERPMEEIQQDPTPSQAPAPASAGPVDLKLDFELGWSTYEELIHEMTRPTSTPRCFSWIL